MRRLLLIFIFGTLFSFQNNAQDSRIYGVVKNYYTNFIIPNASVYLVNNGRIVQKTTSDDSGDFNFSKVQAGEYSISAFDDSTKYSALEHVVIVSDSLFFVSVEMGNASNLQEIIIVQKRPPIMHDMHLKDRERYRSEDVISEVAIITEKKKSDRRD